MDYPERYLGLPRGTCDYSKPAPNQPTHDVVFISIDIEAYEFAPQKILEIGVSSLDTRHLAGVAPGDHGAAWLPKIRSQHYLIEEHAKLINKRYVKGCPDRFHFGKSQIIKSKDAASRIKACFGVPATPETTDIVRSATDDRSKPTYRNIVLVGHALKNDTQYMKALGVSSDPMNTVTDTFDTQWLASSKRHPRSLERVLRALNIEPRYLHNAGNDAAYTLQAFVAMHVLTEEQRSAFTTVLSKPSPGEERLIAQSIGKEDRREAKRKRRAERVAAKSVADRILAPTTAENDDRVEEGFRNEIAAGRAPVSAGSKHLEAP